MTDTDWMKEAVKIARTGIASGQSPFGSSVVKSDKLISSAHNTVWRDMNPTAHAEVNAIKEAAKTLGTVDLKGCTVYTTCEPCPMCLAAIHWSNATRVVYGATIEMAAQAGFRELFIPATKMVEMGKSQLEVIALPAATDCHTLFQEWKTHGQSKSY
ncbi:MAG: nucleoside deaminase [Deltaproteobacteria bacterium]|nr:nucleoside deaminase [Deltaproteobacteria bacterium]MBI3296140.1 nucleoside deaminase [Deltaproteobacteria bacterium]